MAQTKLVVAIILAITTIVLVGIATAIAGIISLKISDPDTKKRLQAIAALSGFGIIVGAITCVLGILYGRARQSQAKNAKGLGIAFLVLAIITGLMFITVMALVLSVRTRSTLTSSQKTSLIATMLLFLGGLITLGISAVLFFSLTKGKSGKEAFQSITLQRRGSSSQSPSPGEMRTKSM